MKNAFEIAIIGKDIRITMSFCRNKSGDNVGSKLQKTWKILIGKDMKKDLQAASEISWASVTKLSKCETVSMEVLMKICKALECNIGDIMDLISAEDKDV